MRIIYYGIASLALKLDCSMKRRDFRWPLSGPSRNEFTALAFLRDRKVFETKLKCPKLSESGQVCGKQMHEGVRNGESYWRFTRRECNATKLVRAMNEFFIHCDQQNIGSHTILELIWQWLCSTSSAKQVALSVSVSENTVTECFHHCRTTVGGYGIC